MREIDTKTWAAIIAHKDTSLESPATIEVINAFEIEHGIVLPEAHREFLLRSNGGVFGYIRLFGVGRQDHLDLDNQLMQMRSYFGGISERAILPFASDWGGSYFCYDLRRSSGPNGYPVLYWNHEFSEEPDDRPMMWSEFAQDFVGFIEEVIKD